MTDAVCSSCNAPIIWAVTKHGTAMPLDAEPTRLGNIRFTGRTRISNKGRRGPEIDVGISPSLFADDDIYISHFATCPNASAHRIEGVR